MNEDIFGHDPTSDVASTPNAAELNAALPQLLSTSTIAFDAFDDLDINQTNFSELDEEEQDIAHIILSDPSLLGLDCLVGAGPLKNRTQGATNAEQGFAPQGSEPNVASSSRADSSAATAFANAAHSTFDFAQLPPVNSMIGASRGQSGAVTDGRTGPVQTNGVPATYGHRPLPSAMPISGVSQTIGDGQSLPRATQASTGSRVGSRPSSPPKAPSK